MAIGNGCYSLQGNSPKLTSRFLQAMEFAFQLHKDQHRKGTDIPYFSHLLAVASLVCEDGGDEDQTIAAILHDTAEDHGGYQTLIEIKQLFGERVADIVATCSDSFSFPKPPWEKRKKDYLSHLKNASPEARRVSLADKLHNARSILRDLECVGESVWGRFNGGKEGTLWYYQSLIDIFNEEQDGYMARELKRVFCRIEEISGGRANKNL
jgi:(p)ppGpp synthase/HD superfamily hydrolase